MKHLLLLLCLCTGAASPAWAQSLCASDGQATPLSLVERFISADCEACWSAPQPMKPSPRTLTLDWIVPGNQGDEAPLAAAATRDASLRLETLRRAAPATTLLTRTPVTGSRASKLRVAHGMALGGYIGASIELKAPAGHHVQEDLSTWLVLVETIAAGAEGTPIERNLVRNVLVSSWNKPRQLSKTAQVELREMRPLSIPPGANPERLRVVGWVQDAQGRILTAAQSVCIAPAPGAKEETR